MRINITLEMRKHGRHIRNAPAKLLLSKLLIAMEF